LDHRHIICSIPNRQHFALHDTIANN
jgi:hypothetical protein